MKSQIAVIGGCGHVGLPLGISFASQGQFNVTLVDVNQDAVNKVNSGKIPFMEHGGEQQLARVIGKTLWAETAKTAVMQAEFVIFVTGTPVDEHLNPKVHEVLRTVDQYLPYLRPEQLLILRSTIFPGVTELVLKYVRNHGLNIDVAFCPERVTQGEAIDEICNLPQIVSAFEPRAEERAARLFQTLTPKILRLTPQEAELTKIISNTWRYLQFAIANQHYMIAEAAGVDFNRVYHAMTDDYPRTKTFMKAGLTAGPCLFKDTMQLSAYYDDKFFIGHAAMLINEGLPRFLITRLEQEIGSLENKKIGLLGMAFKPNHDDIRDSLSYKIKKHLEMKLAEVLDTDVFQPSHERLEHILQIADAFVLGTPHKEYLNLDLRNKPFVDCWGVWSGVPDLTVSPHSPPTEKKVA